MVLIVINGVLQRNVFVPPMSASIACSAAQYILVEGSTHFIEMRGVPNVRLLHRHRQSMVEGGRRGGESNGVSMTDLRRGSMMCYIEAFITMPTPPR